KFITHHCGSMVPYFEKRIKWIMPHKFGEDNPTQNSEVYFRRFYNDTALYGNTPGLMCGYAFFGADHLLFGTDAPLGARFGITGDTLESVEQMDIPDADKQKIFFKNAVNLLRLPT
ncbi:amidohydrolase family protein, partial [Chloroflexota bacterium]